MPTKKDEAASRADDGTHAQPTWETPGTRTGEETDRPRDREAFEGEGGVVPGFTTTGPSGSAGGRKTHGLAPEDLAQDGE